MPLLREYLPVARNLRHRDARYPDDASQLAGLAKGGGRIAAIEVLVSTSLTCNYIERGESERNTTSASSLLAIQCAAVAPTFPAPTTVTLFRPTIFNPSL